MLPSIARFLVPVLALGLLALYAVLALAASPQSQAAAGFLVAGFGGIWACLGELRAHHASAADGLGLALRLLGFAGLTMGSMLGALPAAVAAARLSDTLGSVMLIGFAIALITTITLYIVTRMT